MKENLKLLAEDPVKKIKREATNWQKILAKHISDRGLVSKLYNSEKTNTPKPIPHTWFCSVRKWTRDLNRHLANGDKQMTNKYMKRCSTSYVTRECKLKQQDTSIHLFEWLKYKTPMPNVDKRGQLGSFLQKLKILLSHDPQIAFLSIYPNEVKT